MLQENDALDEFMNLIEKNSLSKLDQDQAQRVFDLLPIVTGQLEDMLSEQKNNLEKVSQVNDSTIKFRKNLKKITQGAVSTVFGIVLATGIIFPQFASLYLIYIVSFLILNALLISVYYWFKSKELIQINSEVLSLQKEIPHTIDFIKGLLGKIKKLSEETNKREP